MRRIILWLIGVLVSTGLVIATPAPAQASSTCWAKASYDEELVILASHPKDIKVWTQVNYFHCKNDQTHNRWVEPHRIAFGYKVFTDEGEAAGVDCEAGFLQNVKFDPNIWDKAGNGIIFEQSTLACLPGGENAHTILLSRPRLFNCGGAPRWTNDIQVSLRGAFDKHPSLAGTMWGFIGPFLVHPNCP